MKPKLDNVTYWRNLSETIGVGMISGTSMDGVDVAIAKFFAGDKALPELLWFSTIPYKPELSDILHEISDSEKGAAEIITRANWAAGHAFADAALQAIAESGIEMEKIQFIGSHGQTIQHTPFVDDLAGYPSRGTLQIGEPAVVASKTGIRTVADFRAADMAAGGQGAPLAPFFDYTFFTHKSESRILLNIGGIANLTYLPPGAQIDEVVAFDSGPGNMIIDGAARLFFDLPYDRDGRIAAEGTVNVSLLAWLKQHPYFQKSWPKSTGRQEFGANFIRETCEKSESLGVLPNNVIATLSRFTAETISEAIRKSVQGKSVDAVFVSGGGSHNRTLMQNLKNLLEPARLLPIDAAGVMSDAKEAVCFAHLALTTLQGKPSNVPSATGANRRVIQGKICLP